MHLVINFKDDVLGIVTEMFAKKTHSTYKTCIVLDSNFYTDETIFIHLQSVNCEI